MSNKGEAGKALGKALIQTSPLSQCSMASRVRHRTPSESLPLDENTLPQSPFFFAVHCQQRKRLSLQTTWQMRLFRFPQTHAHALLCYRVHMNVYCPHCMKSTCKEDMSELHLGTPALCNQRCAKSLSHTYYRKFGPVWVFQFLKIFSKSNSVVHRFPSAGQIWVTGEANAAKVG